MSERTVPSVACELCGEPFDPTESGGWCTNPDCGEWQYETYADYDPEGSSATASAAGADGGTSQGQATSGDASNERGAKPGATTEAGQAPDGGATGAGAGTAPADEAKGDDAAADEADGGDAAADGADGGDAVADGADSESADAASGTDSDDGDTTDATDDARVVASADGADADAEADEGTTGDRAEVDVALEECPECGADVEAKHRFCTGCGTDLDDLRTAIAEVTACPDCGEDVAAGDRYCRACGTDIQATVAGSSEAEPAPDGPAELSLEAYGRSVVVTPEDTVGREVRSLMTEAGRPDDEAVRVHREHVRCVREGGDFHLVDLGENPTAVNGELLEKGDRVPVESGDELTLSEVVTLSIDARSP